MQHIGFIMDGNRRWAKRLGNMASFGHEKGFGVIGKIIDMSLTERIPYVSMWGLSKENISERSADEIQAIYSILKKEIPRLTIQMQEKSVRFETVGDLWLLPEDVRKLLLDTSDATLSGTEMTCILAIGYSGQDEIVRAIRRCMLEGIDPKSLDEKSFLQYLDTGAYPPPDLIVRTGGNIRHSGYFLYQSAYSEYFFTETLWPDFDQKSFDEALKFYQSTQRNFGK